MKKIIRFAIILVLSAIAFLGILSIPSDDSETWITDLFLSESIGFLAAWILYKIILHPDFENKKKRK